MISEILSRTNLLLLPKISLILFVTIYTIVFFITFSKKSQKRYKMISMSIFDETTEEASHVDK